MKGFAVGFLNFLLSLSIAALGLAFMLQSTILNPDFVISELDKLNAYPLVKEQLAGLFIKQIPFESEPLAKAIDATLAENEPWLREQVGNIVYTGHDYFTGKSESLSLIIQPEPIKESLRNNVLEAIQESQLAGVPPAMVEQFINQYLPSTFDLNEILPPEIRGILEQVRQYVSYVQIAFKGLIALTILLILGIILIRREVRASARGIGITFTTYGAIWYGGIFVAKHFTEPQLTQFVLGLGLPTQFQTMIPQLLNDIIAPLQMFSLGFLIAGVALIIVSHVYKPRQPAY